MKKYNVTIKVENLSKEAKLELYNLLEKYEMDCKIGRLFGWRGGLACETLESDSFLTKYLQN